MEMATGTHNRSENGRVSWVDWCVRPTHTDIDSLYDREVYTNLQRRQLDIKIKSRNDFRALYEKIQLV
jgi:hypothetical protein